MNLLTRQQLLDAVQYNTRTHGVVFDSSPPWLFEEFGSTQENPEPHTASYAEIIARAQKYVGLKVDGKHGPSTQRYFEKEGSSGPSTRFKARDSGKSEGVQLTPEIRLQIVSHT